MHILIFGASGHVGTGLAGHLNSAHSITGIVRSQPDYETPYTPVVVPDWVGRPQEVLEALRRQGLPEVDAVVAAIGGWYVEGPMIERGLAAFDADYASYLRGHFTACAVSEALATTRTGSRQITHVTLNGVASVAACVGSGAISVFGAAQEMLLRVAAAESESVTYRELKVMAPIGGDDRNDLTGGVETLRLEKVAEAVGAILSRPADHQICTQISAEISPST